MLDIAVMFDVPALPGIHIQELPAIDFVMVSSRPELSSKEALASGFISVDWGEAFAATFAQHYEQQIVTTMHTSVGGVALDLLLKSGGGAYLPKSMVLSAIERGQLYLVKDAPKIERPVFAVCKASEREHESMKEMMDAMVRILKKQTL